MILGFIAGTVFAVFIIVCVCKIAVLFVDRSLDTRSWFLSAIYLTGYGLSCLLVFVIGVAWLLGAIGTVFFYAGG